MVKAGGVYMTFFVRLTFCTGRAKKDWRQISVEISPELIRILESDDVPEFCTKHVLPHSSL